MCVLGQGLVVQPRLRRLAEWLPLWQTGLAFLRLENGELLRALEVRFLQAVGVLTPLLHPCTGAVRDPVPCVPTGFSY